MTRGQVKRRLALAWWRQVLVAVAPVLVLNLLFGDGRPSVLAMPLFIAGMASMFLSLPLFHAYKRALITTGKALDSEAEPAAWLLLDRVRMRALLGAAEGGAVAQAGQAVRKGVGVNGWGRGLLCLAGGSGGQTQAGQGGGSDGKTHGDKYSG